jgi:hypothetical protein
LCPAACLALALLTSGCLDTSVSFPVTRELAFSSSDLPVIESFQETDAQGVIVVPELACTNVMQCPSHPAINVECNADGLCDPVATSATIAVQDVDLREVMDRFSVVDSIALRGVEYAVLTNTFNVDLPAVEVYWGPAGLASIDGAMRLGSFPALRFGETPMGRVELDSVGSAAMNDHLANVSNQFRLFLEATIDIDPGDRFPQGAFMANVQFEIRASGRAL